MSIIMDASASNGGGIKYGSVDVDADYSSGSTTKALETCPSFSSVQRRLWERRVLLSIAVFEVVLVVLTLLLPSRRIDPSSIQRSLPLLGKANNFVASSSKEKFGNIIVDGFHNSDIGNEKKNLHGHFRWYNAPDSWVPEQGRREGRDGAWSVDDNKESLTLTPPAKKDYWRKTFYEPVLVKDDGPFLYTTLSSDQYYTIETALELTAVRQFDQAGIMVRLGPKYWLKTGIEVVDHQPRLSCVATNEYSDWSTQRWFNYTTEHNETMTVRVLCQIRVHCRGESFVVEANLPDPQTGQLVWQFIRIAHLSRPAPKKLRKHPTSSSAPGEFWAGVFAASPEDQEGGHVVFSQFSIKEGSQFDHNADGNQDSG